MPVVTNPTVTSFNWKFDMSSLISIAVPVSTLLLTQLFNYLSESRARKSWDSILKAINVYSQWVEFGDIKTVVLLRNFINKSIEEQAMPYQPMLTFTYMFSALGLLVDALLVYKGVRRQELLATIPAIISFIFIFIMLYRLHTSLVRYKESFEVIQEDYDELVMKASKIVQPAINFDTVLKDLEKQGQTDAALAELLSSGDPFMRRLYRSALEKARGSSGYSSESDTDSQKQD